MEAGPRRRRSGGRYRPRVPRLVQSGPALSRRRWSLRTLGLLSAPVLVVLILLQGVAAGATTVTKFTPDRYSTNHSGSPTAPPVTVTATADVRATAVLAGLAAAGTQATGVVGLAGTPLALPTCALAACRDRYIVANPAGLVVGDYAEDARLTVDQPSGTTGASSGFLVELVVETSTGWTAGGAYLATGTSTRAAGATVTVLVYLNLGTAAAPTVLKVYTQVDACSSATVCP